MLEMHFTKLNEAEKLQYFEVAANPILQQLINLEIKSVEEQLLSLDKRYEESDTSFRRRFDVLKINRDLLLNFLTINEKVLNEIKTLTNQQ